MTTSDELREHGNWHEHKAQSCADHGVATGYVSMAMLPVVLVFIVTGRSDLMFWTLGIQLALVVVQQGLLKRFQHHANAALGCFIEAELREEQRKTATGDES